MSRARYCSQTERNNSGMSASVYIISSVYICSMYFDLIKTEQPKNRPAKAHGRANLWIEISAKTDKHCGRTKGANILHYYYYFIITVFCQ